MTQPHPRKKVTIKDIARVCNVSAQTVSRVINQRPDVAPATRAAVEQAIEELGYQPSALARSLVQQRSRTLGVIIAGLRYVGVSQTLHGITAQCKESGYALMLAELSEFKGSNLLALIDELNAHHVDGIIFAAPELDDNVATMQEQLPATCPPVVFLKSRPHPRYTTIVIDNREGARTAVRHLLQSGRRRIGHITGPLKWLEARQRRDGWADELAAAGLAAEEECWVQGNWSSGSGEAGMEELLMRCPAIDGLFAANDQMALGALHYLHSRGVAVPEEIAVVGFDNLAESAFFYPSLTTLRQPLRELGSTAVQTLLAQIDGAAPPSDNLITLKPELIVRASTQRNA
ncbi:MAG: LacI family DNA-binding transcriptional regulator [Caldilineaceae bacterium]|nr:LacI family DNA-binding transcriptional regulator [Caldilineaceae bacterium]